MLTKLDLMNEGTDVYDMLAVCTPYSLRLKYVGVVCLGQKALNAAVNKCLVLWLPKTRSSGGTPPQSQHGRQIWNAVPHSQKLNEVLVVHNKISMMFT